MGAIGGAATHDEHSEDKLKRERLETPSIYNDIITLVNSILLILYNSCFFSGKQEKIVDSFHWIMHLLLEDDVGDFSRFLRLGGVFCVLSLRAFSNFFSNTS